MNALWINRQSIKIIRKNGLLLFIIPILHGQEDKLNVN